MACLACGSLRWHDIHELTGASLVQLVDDIVSVVLSSCEKAVLTVRDLNAVGSARCFFTVTSTTHHTSSSSVVNLCMDRANGFCCLGQAGTIPIVEGIFLQCRRKRAFH